MSHKRKDGTCDLVKKDGDGGGDTELRCFLIIFELATKSAKRKFAIAFPGVSSPGLEIYNNLQSILCRDTGGIVRANLEHTHNQDYLSSKEWRFASYHLWKTFAGD